MTVGSRGFSARKADYSPRLGEGQHDVDVRAALVQMYRDQHDVRGLMTTHEDLALAEQVAREKIPLGMNVHEYFGTRLIDEFKATGIKVPETMAAPNFMVFPNFTTPKMGRSMWILRF